MTNSHATPRATTSPIQSRPSWWQSIALGLMALLLIVLPFTLWRQWENAAVPSAALTSNVRVSKKAQTGRIKTGPTATSETGEGQSAAPVTQFIYTHPAGVELARMVPVALQGLGATGPDGEQRTLLVTVAIRNTGSESLQLSPDLFSLADAEGTTYPVTITEQTIKSNGGNARPPKLEATPDAGERSRSATAKPDKGEREKKPGTGSEKERRSATPEVSGTRAASGGEKQRPAREPDSAAKQTSATSILKRQVLPPGKELRVGLPFTLPAAARPGNLMFTPAPDRSLIVADLNALLGEQNAARESGIR